MVREKAWGGLREAAGTAGGVASIEDPDDVEAVVGPVFGTTKLPARDCPGQRRNMAVVPGDQDRPGGRERGGGDSGLFPVGMIFVDLDAEDRGQRPDRVLRAQARA